MQELNMVEVDEVGGAGILAQTGDVLSGAALGMLVFGPIASGCTLFAAGWFYTASAIFE